LFGTTTLAARLPFALTAIISLLLMPLLSKRLFNSCRIGLLAAFFLALSPNFLLFSRNSRYYALAMLLTILAILALKAMDDSRLKTALFPAAVFALFFFTHTLTFLAVGVGLFAMLLLQPKPRPMKTFFLAGFIAFLPAAGWLVYARAWTFSTYQVVRYQYPGFTLGRVIPKPIQDGFLDRAGLFLMSLKNINSFDYFPALFLLPLIYWIFNSYRHRGESGQGLVGENRSLLQLLVFVVIYTACLAFASPQLIGESKAVETRFMTSLLPLFSLLSAFVIARLFAASRVVAVICILLFVYTNVLTLVPVYNLAAEKKPVLHWRLMNYIEEIRSERTTSYEAGMDLIRKHVKQDQTVFFYPEYAMLSHLFYQGDRIRISSMVIDDGSPIWVAARQKLPPYITQPPEVADWILVYGYPTRALRKLLDEKFVLRDVAEVYYFDTSRPEPDLHTFRQRERFNRKKYSIGLFQNKSLLP
jgi:hypothetical protein